MSSGYGMFKMVLSRLYSDYLRKSKLGDYEKIIKYFIKNNYESFSIKEFIKVVRRNQLGENKILILRHDIDTDIGTAKLFFRIEKKYNLKSTYYFRQSTIEIPFMQEIEDYGSEASYHYEEIAQFCKDHSIKEIAEKIKNIFQYNGDIVFDTEKPNGMKRKLLDVSKINSLGWSSSIDLDSGLKNVCSNIDKVFKN